MASGSHGKTLRRADPSTIQDKFLVGYQGWFTCAGDGEPVGPGHHGWLHWFDYPIPDGGRPNTDLWPDVSEYSPSELFPAPGLKTASGEQTYLFSSRHPKTIERHFHWMAMHGVDGAFLQRFAGQTDMEQGNEGIRRIRDEVGDRVREATEKEGRVFSIMYDVAGVAPDRVQRVIERDWLHLIHEKGVLDSPNYLREKGKAVVTLWGFGFSDSHHDPSTVRAITSFIRNNTPGGAYIMAGTPAHWRTSVMDADANTEFVNVWLEEFDAISPWTIGRYGSLEGADKFAEEKIKGDLELIRRRNEDFESGRGGKRKVDYIPVVFPGGSGFNLSQGKWGWNDIPRRGGNFLWRQLFNVRRQNVRTIYGAMWDEYDEGTAFMPVVQNKRQLPVHEKYNFMALDEDGYDLPPDWYMRICGFAVEGLRGERYIHETFPSKELQDYWSTRPRYEEKGDLDELSGSGSASGSGASRKDKEAETWEEWEKKGKGKEAADEPPPPPYSLEAGEHVQPAIALQPVLDPSSSAFPAPSMSGPRPPPTSMATRPTVPPGSHVTTASGSQALPPPVMLTSRPTLPSGAHPSSPSSIPQRPGSAQAVSILADDFSRQSLTSSPSPRLQPPPLHPAHPAAQRPVSPQSGSHLGTSPHSSPPFPSSPYQQSFSSTGGPSAFPTPAGFSPAVNSHSSSGSTSSWSQPTWPPPEWGVRPTSPASHGHQYQSSYAPPQGGGQSGYQPSYGPVYQPPLGPPPPPLQTRPSMSSSHSPYSSHTPPAPLAPQQQSSYAPVEPGVGGFQFPQAQPSLSQHDFYASPPPPQPQPQGPYNAYGPQGPYPGPESSPYPAPSPGPGPGPYGMNNNASANAPYAVYHPPPRPTSQNHNGGGSGSSSSNYLNSAMNALNNATGSNGPLHGLAQSGGKLFSKLKK